MRLQWEWLEWAPLAALLLSALWSLARLLGRAFGRPIHDPLDVVHGTGALAVCLVLGFHQADFANQIPLVWALLLTSFFWGYTLRWLWWRRKAGALALALRNTSLPSPYNWRAVIISAIFAVLFGFILLFSKVEFRTGIPAISGTIFLFLVFAVGIEIRQLGCIDFWEFAPWKEIDSHEWTPTPFKDSLRLCIKRHNNPRFLQQNVRADLKEKVDGLLNANLRQSGPGVTTSDPGLASIPR